VCSWVSSLQRPCAVLYCHLCPVCSYHNFTHFSHKRYDFREKLLNIKCVSIFSNILLSETVFFLILRIQRDIVINVRTFSCNVSVSLELNFLDRFKKKTTRYEIPRKSVQWRPSCSMRTDGQTDRHDETNSHFFLIPRICLET